MICEIIRGLAFAARIAEGAEKCAEKNGFSCDEMPCFRDREDDDDEDEDEEDRGCDKAPCFRDRDDDEEDEDDDEGEVIEVKAEVIVKEEKAEEPAKKEPEKKAAPAKKEPAKKAAPKKEEKKEDKK